MWWYLVLLGLLSHAQAFAPAPIQLAGMPGKRFAIAPRGSPFSSLSPTSATNRAQEFVIRDAHGRTSPTDIPFFTQKPDATISWDAASLCIEASGDKTGDVVRVGRCNGGPAQSWNVLADGRERNTQIQLKNTNKCIDVDANGGLHGAVVELRDCGRKASEHWTWEEPVIPSMQNSSQSLDRILVLLAIGASSFGALLLWWQRTASANMSRRSLPLDIKQGGVCLTVPPASNSGLLPAVMATAVDTASDDIFVDEEAMLADNAFKLPPDQLIELAKKFLMSRGGFGADPELLSPSFQFVAPVVGPLSKDAFLKAIGSVDVKKGFPDFNPEFYNFRVDPFEGNRVWYTARGRGTNSGPLPPFAPTPTGKSVINPPQTCSLTYDEQGLVTKYTIGYVMDREVGNTGGLGGLYGLLYAIGRPLPFPEALPWQKSPPYALFQAVGGLLGRLQGD